MGSSPGLPRLRITTTNMHRPRDEFERQLYGDRTTGFTGMAPVWQLLTLAATAYLVAGILAVFARSVELSPSEYESVVLFGGLLVTLGSGRHRRQGSNLPEGPWNTVGHEH